MTITLAPNPNPRRSDRAPQAKRHTGPYYGERLRRVLAPEPTDPGWIERVTEWYGGLTVRSAWVVLVLTVLAVAAATLIVTR